MRPLVICGTCKELYKCAKLLDGFGYIPVDCRFPTYDNHTGGFLILNREGEFMFSTKNVYSHLNCMVTASDFLKNYGGLGIRSPYNPKNFYFACTLSLLIAGVKRGMLMDCWWLIVIFLVNIPFNFKTIKTWFNYEKSKNKNFSK